MKILQTIENYFQRAARDALRRARPRRKASSLPLASLSRILLVRTDKIGDAVFSTAFFRVLRDAYPTAKIDLVLGRRNHAIAPLLPPLFDEILVTPRGAGRMLQLIRRFRANRYDLAVNLLGSDSNTAAAITLLSGARFKLGFSNAASAFYDVVVPLGSEPVPFARRVLSLAPPLGISLPDESQLPLSLAIPPDAHKNVRADIDRIRSLGRPIVMINISCTMPERFWGPDHSVRLAHDLRRDGFEPVIVAAPDDAAMQQHIANAGGAIAIPPRSSLAEFVAVLSAADLVITPDTSVTHICAALGKPTVMTTESPYKAIEGAAWCVPNRALAGSGHTVRDIPYDTIASAVRDLAQEVLTDARPRSAAGAAVS